METKPIIGLENLYTISNYGIVYSLRNGKPIKPRKKKNGYLEVKLSDHSSRYFYLVHRLVAIHFVLNEHSKKEVNHLDGNKLNNHVSNLEWVTSSENQKHAFKIGLQKSVMGKDHKQSIPIIQLSLDGSFVNEFESIKSVKRLLGFNTFGIIKCCKKEKKYNTAYGYKWQYKNQTDLDTPQQ